jgi:hypothetical protein
MKPIARIENWSFGADPLHNYMAPEQMKFRLHGDVRGHYRVGDRDNQTTSTILGKTEDGKVVTRNTLYELGQVHPEYEKQFPNALDRLMQSLTVIEEVEA